MEICRRILDYFLETMEGLSLDQERLTFGVHCRCRMSEPGLEPLNHTNRRRSHVGLRFKVEVDSVSKEDMWLCFED